MTCCIFILSYRLIIAPVLSVDNLFSRDYMEKTVMVISYNYTFYDWKKNLREFKLNRYYIKIGIKKI